MVYDLIIIGAGPAGTAAAIYASRQKLNFIIISKDIGGQLGRKAIDIENYPGYSKISGAELAEVFEKQLKENNVKIVSDEVEKIEKNKEKFELSTKFGEKYKALSVIIATGADPRPLEVLGEKEFIGKGVSYCALCDGPIFRDKIVAVIGGGNSGFETSSFLANYVKKIYLLESGEKIQADEENQELAKKTGKLEIILNAKILKIEGNKFVNLLVYKDVKNNSEHKLEVEGIFVEIGYTPATAFVKNLVSFSKRDEIITERETFATKTPGLFAAGDCNEGRYKQIVTATGEGAKAALSAYEYIQKIKQ